MSKRNLSRSFCSILHLSYSVVDSLIGNFHEHIFFTKSEHVDLKLEFPYLAYLVVSGENKIYLRLYLLRRHFISTIYISYTSVDIECGDNDLKLYNSRSKVKKSDYHAPSKEFMSIA